MPSSGWDADYAVKHASKVGFHGNVWRAHWRDVAPTDWTLSLRSSGRYHQGQDLFPTDQCWPALYTSLAPEVAVWEMVRRSAAQNLSYLRNNVLTELVLNLNVVLDASPSDNVGLQPGDLTGTNVAPCRQLALAAVKQGFEGLLVPSAAMRGTNLVLLPSNLPGPLPAKVVNSRPLPIEIMNSKRG